MNNVWIEDVFHSTQNKGAQIAFSDCQRGITNSLFSFKIITQRGVEKKRLRHKANITISRWRAQLCVQRTHTHTQKYYIIFRMEFLWARRRCHFCLEEVIVYKRAPGAPAVLPLFK